MPLRSAFAEWLSPSTSTSPTGVEPMRSNSPTGRRRSTGPRGSGGGRTGAVPRGVPRTTRPLGHRGGQARLFPSSGRSSARLAADLGRLRHPSRAGPGDPPVGTGRRGRLGRALRLSGTERGGIGARRGLGVARIGGSPEWAAFVEVVDSCVPAVIGLSGCRYQADVGPSGGLLRILVQTVASGLRGLHG